MSKRLAWVLSLILGLGLLALVVVAGGLTGPALADAPSEQAAAQTMDDEIVLLRDDKIRVYDPYPMYGSPLEWSRSDYPTKWKDVSTGDFNGDGDDEIVVINYTDQADGPPYERILRVYDPVSGPAPEFHYGYTDTVTVFQKEWWHLATGDVDDDGKDEVVAVTELNNNQVSEFSVFDPADAVIKCSGTVTHGHMSGLTVADITGDGYPEIVFAGHVSANDAGQGYMWWVDGTTCRPLASSRRPGVLWDLTAGDVDANGHQEVALVAEPPPPTPTPSAGAAAASTFKTLAIWNSIGGSPVDDSDWYMQDLGWGTGFGSRFRWGFVTAGDLDSSGDDEIIAIRDAGESTARLLVKDPDYVGDGISNTYFKNTSTVFTGVKAGNFEGSNRDLTALFAGNKVYLYDFSNKPSNPKPIKSWTVPDPNWDSGIKVMAVGDFDGAKMQVSPDNVSFFLVKDRSIPDPSTHVQVYYAPGVTCNFSSTTPTVDWLTVSPTQGPMPGDLVFSVHSGGMGTPIPTGIYTTTVTITGTTTLGPARGSPYTANVTLTVLDEMFRDNLPLVKKTSSQ